MSSVQSDRGPASQPAPVRCGPLPVREAHAIQTSAFARPRLESPASPIKTRAVLALARKNSMQAREASALKEDVYQEHMSQIRTGLEEKVKLTAEAFGRLWSAVEIGSADCRTSALRQVLPVLHLICARIAILTAGLSSEPFILTWIVMQAHHTMAPTANPVTARVSFRSRGTGVSHQHTPDQV